MVSAWNQGLPGSVLVCLLDSGMGWDGMGWEGTRTEKEQGTEGQADDTSTSTARYNSVFSIIVQDGAEE